MANRGRRRAPLPGCPGAKPWEPNWTIAPGETLREWMSEHGLDIPVLAAAAGKVTRDDAGLLIADVLARKPLTEAHAAALERCTGISARMWSALESNYRVGLAAGLTDVSES
jgi:plasmid maintenance system antidote protein VapI